MEALLAELQKTNARLEELAKIWSAANKPAIALGFQNPPRARYIYANRQYPDCLWYFWNGAKSTYEPIETHALTGFIEKIEIEDKEFRGKPDPKLNLHIRAEKPYVLQAGLETLFARGLIYTLSKLPLEALKSAITIAVEPGDTEQVLFSKVYCPLAGTAFYASYGEERNIDWSAMARALCLRFGSTESLPVQDSNIQDSNIQDQTRPPVSRAPEPRPTETIAPRSEKNVAPRKVVLPSIEPAFDPLSGQGSIVGNATPIVDTIRQDLRNAITLRDFSRLKKLLSDNASSIGEIILSKLQDDINLSYKRAFPPVELEKLKNTIKQAKENLEWSPDRFGAFLSEKFPGCATTAHLTMEQIRKTATFLSTEAEQQLVYGAQSDYDNIPF